RKLHLKFSERVRALARDHNRNQACAEQEQYPETDREIALAHFLDGALERSRPILYDELPGLANQRALESASRSRLPSSPACASTRPARATSKKGNRRIRHRDVFRLPLSRRGIQHARLVARSRDRHSIGRLVMR